MAVPPATGGNPAREVPYGEFKARADEIRSYQARHA